jgi:hypothetical protein
VALGAEKRLHPRARLQQVRDDVPVQKHRSLGDPGRTAGVLQKCDVLVRDGRVLELATAAFRERFGQAHRSRQTPARNHLLHVAQHEVDQDAFQSEHLADAGDDDLFDRGLPDHFLHRIREVLDDDDHLRAAVGQLVLELPRRIQRIGVHDGATRTQDAEETHRVLKNVGHHERDARAFPEPAPLQERSERGRQAVELGKSDRLAHAGVGSARTEIRDDAIEHVTHRRVGVDIDVRGDAFRVRLEPDPLHALLPGRSFYFGPMLAEGGGGPECAA